MAGASGAIITREIHRPDCIVITFSRKCECCGYVELRTLNTIVFYGSRKTLGNFTCTKCKSNTEVTILDKLDNSIILKFNLIEVS